MKRNTVVEQLYLLAFCVGLADVLWLPADVASRLTLMDLFFKPRYIPRALFLW